MATERTHALLIGIDAYTGAKPLRGCVNDIDAIQRLLIDRVGIPREHITRLAAPRAGNAHETDVPSAPPTLANILAALRALTTAAVEPGHRVFIYYAGHGTQLRLIGPSGVAFFREALLPTDHLVYDERQFLFDWEINELLAGIAGRTQNVSFILDCCCSSGATRALPGQANGQVRFHPTQEAIPLPQLPAALRDSGRGVKRGLVGRVASCLVLAACLDDQRAHETDAAPGGRQHGELTRALVDELAKVPDAVLPGLRLGSIWRAVVTAVRAANPAQHPFRSGGDARFFFGGPAEEGDAGYRVTRMEDRYLLDAGTLTGVTPGAEVALYGAQPLRLPTLGSAEDKAARIGRLRVTDAWPSLARATALDRPKVVDGATRGRLVAPGAAARLRVSTSPRSQGLAEALSARPCLELVDELPEVQVVQRPDGKWAVTDDAFGDGTIPGEPAHPPFGAKAFDEIAIWLEGYFGYSTPLRLARVSASLPGVLQINVLDCNGIAGLVPAGQAQNPLLPEAPLGERFSYELCVGDRVCVQVSNQSEVNLWLHLLICQMSGQVHVIPSKLVPARGKCVFWHGEQLGAPFVATLPSEQLRVGLERLVAVGTTKAGVSLHHLEKLDGFRSHRTSRATEAPRAAPNPEVWTSAVATLRVQ